MSRRAIELLFVSVVALAEAVGTILIVVASNHEPHKLLAAALTCIVGLSFVFSGLLALHFRPDNKNGLYLAAVGYLWFFRAPYDANNSLAFTLGVMLSSVAFIPFAALISGFPSGRLDALGRRLVRLTVVLVFVVSPLSLLFTSKQPGCTDCPSSAFLVYDAPGLAKRSRPDRDDLHGRPDRLRVRHARPAVPRGDEAGAPCPAARLRGRGSDPRHAAPRRTCSSS